MIPSSRDPQELRLIHADGFGLLLTFRRDTDRYRHSISVITPGGTEPWLESVDSDGQCPWPESPPYQELSIELQNDRHVALLVGMAGKSYWSASIESGVAPCSLRFDVACRLREPPEKLGNTYRLLRSPHRLPPSPGANSEPHSCVLRPSNENAVCEFREQASQVSIVPRTMFATGVATIRWQYEICWEDREPCTNSIRWSHCP